MTVLVEGFAPDAVTVARLLAEAGEAVRVAGRGDVPPAAAALRELGVVVEPDVDLDADPGHAEVAYLDVWTPETAPRVAALRARGTRITCASELLLERAAAAGARTVGVTGTAGKSTTAGFLAQLLDAAGSTVHAADDGRLGNLWVTARLLERALAPPDVVVVELTSSHLAFMRSSPDVAVVTCFWPDHVELHGTFEAYRAAKEVIVRYQRVDGAVVVSEDDEATAGFAALTPARRLGWSRRRAVPAGAFLDGGSIVVRRDGVDTTLAPLHASPVIEQAVLAACAAAVSLGVPSAALRHGLGTLEPPPHRQQRLSSVGRLEIVDDGMATTPAKARAALMGRPPRSVVVIAGGALETDGGPVHASPEERPILEACCDEIGRVGAHVVLFGESAGMLARELAARGVQAVVVPTLDDAVREALIAAGGAEAVVFAPVFPVSLEDRARFASLVEETAATVRVRDSRP